MNINNNSTVLNSTGQWDDMQGTAIQGVTTSALNVEAFRDTNFMTLAMRHDQGDELSFAFQLSHRWKKDTPLYFHLHVSPMASWEPEPATKDVYFEYRYYFSKIGEEIPAVSSWSEILYHTYSVAPTDQYKHKLVPVFNYTPTGGKESDILLVRIKRLGTDVLDTYNDSRGGGGTATANLCILYADVHFETEKFGTATEIPA